MGSATSPIFRVTFFLPSCLLKEITEFCGSMVQWEDKPIEVWTLPKDGTPCGLTSCRTHVYVCDPVNNCLLQYNLTGSLADIWPLKTTGCPRVVDFSKYRLYLIHQTQLQVLNIQKEILIQWNLPSAGEGVKVDDDYVYITAARHHQIFVYTKSGILKKKFGKESLGTQDGEFNHPCGLAVDHTLLYICDWRNHRIQALRKDDGVYSHQWGRQGSGEGEFTNPVSIYLSGYVLYVGDWMSVQLFTVEGIFLQRLGQSAIGIEVNFLMSIVTVVKDRLFVSDFHKNRIQVFRRLDSTEQCLDSNEEKSITKIKSRKRKIPDSSLSPDGNYMINKR